MDLSLLNEISLSPYPYKDATEKKNMRRALNGNYRVSHLRMLKQYKVHLPNKNQLLDSLHSTGICDSC